MQQTALNHTHSPRFPVICQCKKHPQLTFIDGGSTRRTQRTLDCTCRFKNEDKLPTRSNTTHVYLVTI